MIFQEKAVYYRKNSIGWNDLYEKQPDFRKNIIGCLPHSAGMGKDLCQSG